MVSAKKELKNQLLAKWQLLKRFVPHPDLGRAASLLMDTRPLVASNKILVVECSITSSVEKINDRKIHFA